MKMPAKTWENANVKYRILMSFMNKNSFHSVIIPRL